MASCTHRKDMREWECSVNNAVARAIVATVIHLQVQVATRSQADAAAAVGLKVGGGGKVEVASCVDEDRGRTSCQTSVTGLDTAIEVDCSRAGVG